MEKRTSEEQKSKNIKGIETWLDDSTIKGISNGSSSNYLLETKTVPLIKTTIVFLILL